MWPLTDQTEAGAIAADGDRFIAFLAPGFGRQMLKSAGQIVLGGTVACMSHTLTLSAEHA